MKVAIVQSNYIPWRGYFDLISEADVFIFLDEVQYTRRDWRNRNKIYTKNGLQWLTIPVADSVSRGKISEVVLEPERWQETHHKSLEFGYKAAPYFGQLQELATDYLVDKKWHSLKDLNQYLIRKIAGYIGLTTKFEDSAGFRQDSDRIGRLVGLCRQVGATTYISGPSARDYLAGSEKLWADAGIELVFKSYPDYPKYKQLSEPFESNVSILDLIANVPRDQLRQYVSRA